jgi:GT2 family glycosyltransferase
VDLSIVIVNHNTKKLTEQTIDSVIQSTRTLQYEIIVVDNSNNPQERYQSVAGQPVILIPNVENKGFGHACNLGSKQAIGEAVLFLNSDTILHEGALDRSVAYLRDHKEVGALGIRTLLADGTLDHGCKRGFPTPANALYYYLGMDRRHPESKKYGAYRQTFVDEHTTSEVDAVSGSFLLIPREVLQAVGGFDEEFFMYGEDLDLCYRIKKKGYRVVYYADAQMTHLKGQSGLHTKSKEVIYHFYNAMILFYKKHYIRQYNILITCMVYCGVWLKYLLTVLKSKISG